MQIQKIHNYRWKVAYAQQTTVTYMPAPSMCTPQIAKEDIPTLSSTMTPFSRETSHLISPHLNSPHLTFLQLTSPRLTSFPLPSPCLTSSSTPVQAADAYMVSAALISGLCLITGLVVILGVPEERSGEHIFLWLNDSCMERLYDSLHDLQLSTEGRRAPVLGLTDFPSGRASSPRSKTAATR